MDKFTKVTSKVIPLPMKDVDTDLIIPAQFLTSISRDGYGANLFRRLKDNDPNFAMNLDTYKGAEILVADSNFACGSSREHAVWAIYGAGIRVVISKSFADIFYSNSAKNGLLCVTLPDAVVDKLLEQAKDPNYKITVDLENQSVILADGSVQHFEYDAFRKHCMLNGLDDIEYMRSFADDIKAHRQEIAKHQHFSTSAK
jgi:3-isopropylmalate/(R)-2-methylmalate dehydratase small subunit